MKSEIKVKPFSRGGFMASYRSGKFTYERFGETEDIAKRRLKKLLKFNGIKLSPFGQGAT